MVFGSKFGSGLFQINQTSASNLSDNHYFEITRNLPFIWCRVMLATQDKHNLGCQRVAWLQSQSSTGYYWERAVKVTWLTSLLYNTTQDFSCLVPLISFGKRSGIPECFLTWNKPGRSQSRMPVLSWDRKEDVPKCSGREISQNFLGEIWFPGNGIWERRPLFDKVQLLCSFGTIILHKDKYNSGISVRNAEL